MSTKRSVLIPMDGSGFSRNILAQVTHLLPPAETKLTLLHVAHYPAGITGLPARPASPDFISLAYYESGQDLMQSRHPIFASQTSGNVAAEVQATLQEDARRLTRAGYETATLVRFGEPAQEIVALAQQGQFDMVAMTTHGRSGLNRLLFGSVAEAVVRSLTVPVLLLRPFAEPTTDTRPDA